MKIGRIIHYYRKNNNMTQEELAFRLGVSGTSVSKWENDLSYPETSLLPKMADIFGISINQLFKNDFVLVSIIQEIIEEANNPKKNDLKESINYLENSLLDYPENEALKFEIARKYLLSYNEKKDKQLIKKAISIFEDLSTSEKKDVSEWSKHYLSMIFSKIGKTDRALDLNKQLTISNGINPKLDNIEIKLVNNYENVDKDIDNHLINLMEDYYSYWIYLYEYYCNKKMYENILREGLKYIGIIINFIGKDKSVLFKQLCSVYYDLGVTYFKVNNKMRSDECFISSLLYAKKYDELDQKLIKGHEKISLFKVIKNNGRMLEEIKFLIENNEEQEIKDKLHYFLTRIKF